MTLAPNFQFYLSQALQPAPWLNVQQFGSPFEALAVDDLCSLYIDLRGFCAITSSLNRARPGRVLLVELM
jgi:hypothetical protein